MIIVTIINSALGSRGTVTHARGENFTVDSDGDLQIQDKAGDVFGMHYRGTWTQVVIQDENEEATD